MTKPGDGRLPAVGVVIYATIAWVPCLVGGIIMGSAIAAPHKEEGVIQGRTLGLSAAMPEILASTLILLAVAYVGPVLYLNRKRP